MTTFKDLEPGTVVSYADSANYLREAIIIKQFSDKWGEYVQMVWKDDNKKYDVTSHTKVNTDNYTGWNIVATPEY